jgi:acetyltransferase-like isoleucine patch superfamily enzyme
MYITIVFTSLFFAKLLLVIINHIHKPREGVFLRDRSDKDFRYWSLRNTVKRWPVWLAHKLPLPYFDNFCFKVFGVKTTLSNSLFEGWVDCEFVEFGENVVIGQACLIQSALIIGNLLIIKKTVIGDNVRIGAHTVVMPGTQIGKNCVLAASSVTTVDQKLEEGWIYLGVPATKYKKNRFFEDEIENKITHVEDIEGLRDEYEKKYLKWYDNDITWTERKKLTRQKKDDEKRRLRKDISD